MDLEGDGTAFYILFNLIKNLFNLKILKIMKKFNLVVAFIFGNVLIFSTFFLPSCVKESGDKSIKDVEKVFVEQRTMPTQPIDGCEPEDFGYWCAAIYSDNTRQITDINGCVFNVKMKFKECWKNGERHLVFKLVSISSPINIGVEPCQSWWNNLISLPPAQFENEWNLLENRLTSDFIYLEMSEYTLGNPLNASCAGNGYLHSSFFKPICTMLCSSPNDGFNVFYRAVCAVGGCCVEIRSYCINIQGNVSAVYGGVERLSDCGPSFGEGCLANSQPMTRCSDNGCGK